MSHSKGILLSIVKASVHFCNYTGCFLLPLLQTLTYGIDAIARKLYKQMSDLFLFGGLVPGRMFDKGDWGHTIINLVLTKLGLS